MSDKTDDSKKAGSEQTAAKPEISEPDNSIGGHAQNIKASASEGKSAAQSSQTKGKGVYLLAGLLLLCAAVGAYFYFKDKKQGEQPTQ